MALTRPTTQQVAHLYEDTVAAMRLLSPPIGSVIQTKGYDSVGDRGHSSYVVAASTTVDELSNHTLANGNVALVQASGRVRLKQFGAVDGTDATASFVAAGEFLLGKDDPGGTIHVDGEYTLGVTGVNWWDILAAQQGITPATDYLPNGNLVRGTYLALEGDGYERSKINVVAGADGLVWGNYTSISDKRAMSGHVTGIDFAGPGAVGHTAQIIVSGAQGYSTITHSLAGTTDTTTRCLVFEECVPNTFVVDCRFRYFQEAVHQTYGFGFIADRNDIQYCNIGYYFDTGVTTWSVLGGNEVEVCAIGVFSMQTSNGYIGPAVIEANLAGCDVLVFISKYLTMEGT